MKLPKIIWLRGKACDISMFMTCQNRAFVLLSCEGMTLLEFEDSTIKKVKARMIKWLKDNKL